MTRLLILKLARLKRRFISLSDNIFVDAAGEFLVVFLISNSFLALAVLFHYLGVADVDAKYELVEVLAILKNDWKPGEIFIYVSAVLAPIPYVMYGYHRNGKRMPFYWLFVLALGVVFMSCTVIFAYHRTGNIKNESFLFISSLVLYIAALVVWYFGLVLQRRLVGFGLIDAGEDRANAMVKLLAGEAT